MVRGFETAIAKFLFGCSLVVFGLAYHDALAQSAGEQNEAQELDSAEVQKFQKKILILSPPPVDGGQEGDTEDNLKNLDTLRSDLIAKVDHTKIDPRRLQERLGSDPLTLLGFVRDHIGFEPYVGALRGSRGTLQARSGNGIDRALLLADLLRHAGYQVRFAEAELTLSDAETLVQGSLMPSKVVSAGSSEFLDALLTNAARHFLLIADALNNAGFVPSAGSVGSEWRSALGNSQTHIWVQYADRDNQWHDLDPLPGLESGETLAPAERILESIDEYLYHSISFELQIETRQDGETQRDTLLVYEARAMDLAGTTMGLTHQVEGTEARALLHVGSKIIESSPFEIPLEVGAPGTSAVSALGGLLNIFDQLPGGEPESQEASIVPVNLVSEELVVHATGPAGDWTVRYPIYRTTNGAVPQGELVRDALSGVLGISIIVGDVAYEGLVLMLAEQEDYVNTDGVIRLINALVQSYVILRQQMPGSFLEPPARRYIDRPNIVITEAREVNSGSGIRLSLDLTLKGYRIWLSSDEAQAVDAVFYDYLANGVLDHAVERALLGYPSGSSSVGALFEVASRQGIVAQLFTTQHHNIPTWLSSKSSNRVAAMLNRGKFIVLPIDRPTDWADREMGWWEIDPVTGWTEDRTESGGHAEGVEYATGVAERASWQVRVRKLACTLAIVASSAGGQIGEAMVAAGDASGAVLITIGGLIEAIGECPPGPKVPRAPMRPVPGFGLPNPGFPTIHRVINRRPDIFRGRVFPGR